MKIGILTFHEADNCGAVLQAYALTETLKSNIKNAEVEIINYHMPYITHQYKYISLNTNGFIPLLKSIGSSLFHIKRKISSKPKYKNFRTKHMVISGMKYLESTEIQNYDAYIVGSDQVWNKGITNGDSVFFLDFADKKSKKISYAASIAKDNLSDIEFQEIADNLGSFDAVSVREISAANNLQQYTTKKVYQVLDPTLIADKSIWNNLIKIDSCDEPYILVYMVDFNKEVLEVAKEMSKKLNLPVWCITTATKTKGYDFRFIKDIGPIEFLQLFSSAKFIISSSFHGTAFSIIFNKNFVTMPHKETSSRMTDLLHLLGLEDRILNGVNELENNLKLEINYDVVNRKLEDLKELSLTFLKESLDSNNKRDLNE